MLRVNDLVMCQIPSLRSIIEPRDVLVLIAPSNHRRAHGSHMPDRLGSGAAPVRASRPEAERRGERGSSPGAPSRGPSKQTGGLKCRRPPRVGTLAASRSRLLLETRYEDR